MLVEGEGAKYPSVSIAIPLHGSAPLTPPPTPLPLLFAPPVVQFSTDILDLPYQVSSSRVPGVLCALSIQDNGTLGVIAKLVRKSAITTRSNHNAKLAES